MATKVKEQSVEDKLKSLYNLQAIHSKLDEIHILKGELPMEVSDLEDEIQGLKSRIEKLETEIEDLGKDIAAHKNGISEAEVLISKYEKQQLNVKNNREYDALTKEIELQRLEMQLGDKRISESNVAIEGKNAYLEESKGVVDGKNGDLEIKKKELLKIIKDTEKEEIALAKEAKKAETIIEERLISAFDKIRLAYRNKLAVVKFERDSCGGCFAKIPPQRQLEIRQRKKIIVCEHCGRVLVDPKIED